MYCSNIELLDSKNIASLIDYKYVINYFQGVVTSIDLLGGEPLLHPNIIDIIEAANRYGIKTSVVTNGQFDGEIIERLINSNIKNIVISIEGMKNAHDHIRGAGSWDNAIFFLEKACEYIKKKNSLTQIGINIVVNRFNKNEIIDLIDFTKIYDISYQTTHLVAKGNAVKNLNDLSLDAEELIAFYESLCEYWIENPNLKIQLVQTPHLLEKYLSRKYGINIQIAENKCVAGTQMISMDPYGNVFPCNLYKSGVETHNILKRSLSDIFSSFHDFLPLTEHNHSSNCTDCDFRHICFKCPFSATNSAHSLCSAVKKKIESLDTPLNAYFKLSGPVINMNSDFTKIFFPKINMMTEYTKEGATILKLINNNYKNLESIQTESCIDMDLVYEFLLQEKHEGKVIEQRR